VPPASSTLSLHDALPIFQSEFITGSQVTPEDAVRLTAEDLYELFSAGQVAMINAASVRVPAMQEQVGAENVGFMHYPSEDGQTRSEEHTSELQSRFDLVC